MILSGKEASDFYSEEIAKRATNFSQRSGRKACLKIFLVGENPASLLYVGSKVKRCESVGMLGVLEQFPEDVSEAEFLQALEAANEDETVDGIIIQLPIPKHLQKAKVTEKVVPQKDVDGLSFVQQGRLMQNLPCFVSATPLGVQMLLEYYKIEVCGKDVVVLGRSNIVGTPMGVLLSRSQEYGNATVTICHSKTKNMQEHTRRADILIVALGIPKFIGKDMVKEGAVVIDVGIHKVADASKKSGYATVGDVDFSEVAEITSAYTPVPKGVGPMTIIGLLSNTMDAAEKKVDIG